MTMDKTIHIEKPTIFPPTVMAGVTLRNADAFPPHGFSMLKAGILSPEEVRNHRLAFAQQIGVAVDALQFQSQVHGTDVRIVEQEQEPGESDGMITATPGMVLCVSIADCGAVLLYDPDHGVVAGLHSGWRGTHGNITSVGLQALRTHFGTRPESLLAYISPCASGREYIVRADVADLFPGDIKHDRGGGEWTLDIRQQIYRQLLTEGVAPAHIQRAEGCSIAEDRYHSYRRDGAASGRMIAFISLRSEQESIQAGR